MESYLLLRVLDLKKNNKGQSLSACKSAEVRGWVLHQQMDSGGMEAE